MYGIEWANYSQAKNKTTNLIRKSKRKYFREKIDENKGNSRGIWKASRTLSGTIKSPVDIKELITENGIVSDKTSIANTLNHYFTNVVEQISEGNDYSDEYDDSKLRSFVLSRLSADATFTIPEITIEQITEIILKISNNKETGHDGISVRVIKEILPAFVSRLCGIINLSITTNVFPEKWKIAQVTPLHKGGVRNDINNYRPISILPTLSKILKKHVANSLLKSLRDNNLIYCGVEKGSKGGSAPPSMS